MKMMPKSKKVRKSKSKKPKSSPVEEAPSSPTRRKQFYTWEDLEKFTSEIGGLLEPIEPCIAKEAFATLQSIYNKIEESLSEIHSRDARIVLSGPQGTMKTDLLNGILCGNAYLQDGIRTRPLISKAGGESVTSVPLEVKYASQYSLKLGFWEEAVLKERCAAEQIAYEPVRNVNNLLPEMADWNPKKQMDTIHAKLLSLPEYLTQVERLGLKLILLQGPFPCLPKGFVFVDTPGFGHTSDNDPDGEKTKKILLDEYRKMDALFAVLPRAADYELLKVYYNLGAFHERNNQIPLMVSVFHEEGMDPAIVERDLSVLRRAIVTASDTLLYENALPLDTDIYSHQRVFNYLTNNATIFQRKFYTSNRAAFHSKMEDIRQIVKQMDMEVFSLNSSSFLSTCRAAIKGKPVYANKLDRSFATCEKVTAPVFWPPSDGSESSVETKLSLAHTKVTQKVMRLFLIRDDAIPGPQELTQAIYMFFRNHLRAVVCLGVEYVIQFLHTFSKSYDDKIDSENGEGYYVQLEGNAQDGAGSETFTWFKELFESVGMNKKDHFMRTNTGSYTDSFIEYHLRILKTVIEKAVREIHAQMDKETEDDTFYFNDWSEELSSIIGSDSENTDDESEAEDDEEEGEEEEEEEQSSMEIDQSGQSSQSSRNSGVVSAAYLKVQASKQGQVNRMTQYASNVVVKVIESETYKKFLSIVRKEAAAILERVKDCVKQFNSSKVSEQQKIKLDDMISEYLGKLRKVLKQRYEEVHTSLPDEDANHPLPKQMPLDELIQMIKLHAQSKKELKKRDARPWSIEFIEEASTNPRVLEVEQGNIVTIHPETLRQIRILAAKSTPQALSTSKFIFPMFIVSWVPSSSALPVLNFTFASSKKNNEGKLVSHDMDGLPHAIFVVVEKSQRQMYLDHLAGHHCVYIVVLPKDNVSVLDSLNICKALAEKLEFPFWWRAAHHIQSMHQFMRSTFKARKCSFARGLLYAESVMCKLYVHLFSTISTHLRKNIASFIRLISLAHKVTGELDEKQPALVDKFLSLAEDVESLEDADSMVKPEDALQLVEYLEELMKIEAIQKQYIKEAKGNQEKIKKLEHLKQVMAVCVEHVTIALRCNMVTFVLGKEQLRKIWQTYPKDMSIIGHRAGFNECVLNSTIAQRNYWFGKIKDSTKLTTEKHESLAAFDGEVRTADESLANKLFKDGHNGILLANFARKRVDKKTIEMHDEISANEKNTSTKNKNKNSNNNNNNNNNNDSTTTTTTTTTTATATPTKRKLFTKGSQALAKKIEEEDEEEDEDVEEEDEEDDSEDDDESQKGKGKGKGKAKAKAKGKGKAPEKGKEREKKKATDAGEGSSSKRTKR